MPNAFIAFGSNLGHSADYYEQACELIHQIDQTRLTAKSSLFRTNAVTRGSDNQPEYLNACIGTETTLDGQQLFRSIQEIETKLGRVRQNKWEARTVDLDLILYGVESINEPDLIVPHPRMSFRRFVLEPLAEIAAEHIHPKCQTTIADLLHTINLSAHRIFVRSDASDENRKHFVNYCKKNKIAIHDNDTLEIQIEPTKKPFPRWSIEFGDFVTPAKTQANLTIDISNPKLQSSPKDRATTVIGPRLHIDDGPVSQSIGSEIIAAIESMRA